jgi:hypothetical protein
VRYQKKCNKCEREYTLETDSIVIQDPASKCKCGKSDWVYKGEIQLKRKRGRPKNP